MTDTLSLLVPQPQEIQQREGAFTLPDLIRIHVAAPAQAHLFTGDYLAEQLNEMGLRTALTASAAGNPAITLHVDPHLLPKAESYRLLVDETGVLVIGADRAGLFYGVVTLCQLVQLHLDEDAVSLPHLLITDWPDFPHRGIMLDISRDKVPSMETLFDLIDLAASLKLNQLQLYMEHTFAYQGHEEVWALASPLTGEEVLTLDAYARERFVELVPNQNSLGHMHRWLKHDRYRHLAEMPEGTPHPFHPDPEPFSLCPEDPGSLDLIRDLYHQLLPHFSSRQFNVGLDETFDIGLGRSKAACAERGAKRVYLDYLLKVHEEVRRRGRVMQFWGDIIIQEPALIPELPKDAIALEWGYDAAHPFEEHGRHFA
ncbi:MAG: glycoside hydrolase, partial [Caldilineae bacterium]